MKINILCVGQMREKPLKELVDNYVKRANFYMPFEITVIPDLKAAKTMQPTQQCVKEGEAILAKLTQSDHVVLMDERGREMTSNEFSGYINKMASAGLRNLVFVIGGPFGFSPDVYARANDKLAISKMTFTHEMARVLTAEQIYRALSILNGSKYHHN